MTKITDNKGSHEHSKTVNQVAKLISVAVDREIGNRKFHKFMRTTKIMDDKNNILPPYDDMGYFDYWRQRIHSPYGRKLKYYYKIIVTKAGFDFLLQFVRENIHLL